MCRKPTHTDQYLHWDSNHHITAKQSVFNTLAHRAKTVSSTQASMDKELDHIKTALKHCQFPSWALNQWQHRFSQSQQHSNNPSNNSSSNIPTDKSKNKATIVVSYIPNMSEKFKKVCKRKGIQVHFKGSNTLRTALGNPKDKDPKANQTGIIYHYQCPHINCPSSCIGESGRTLGDRIKEHFKAPSPHTPTQLHHRPSHGTQPIQYSSQGSQQPTQDYQGGHVHLCTGPPIKQKPWKVPASPHMGPSTSGITNTSVQANKPTIQLYSFLNPPTWFPPPSNYFHTSPINIMAGGAPILFPMVSTHVYPKYPLSLSTTSPTPAPSW